MTLTREQVLEMKEGRGLDRLIKEHVFKEDLSEYHWARSGPSMFRNHEGGVNWIDIPQYSTDISAAWEVVEMLQASHMYTDIRTCADFYEVWIVIPPFMKEEQGTETVSSPKISEAICKAALLTTIGEET